MNIAVAGVDKLHMQAFLRRISSDASCSSRTHFDFSSAIERPSQRLLFDTMIKRGASVRVSISGGVARRGDVPPFTRPLFLLRRLYLLCMGLVGLLRIALAGLKERMTNTAVEVP
jgi:hypothetical protein